MPLVRKTQTGRCGGMIGRLRQRLVGKFAALFGAAGLLVAVLSFVTLQQILAPTFDAIEAQANADQQARVASSLVEFDTALQGNASDYAYWDESFEYIQRPNKSFEAESFSALGYQNQGVDYEGVVRFDGTPVWSVVRDLETGEILVEESRLITAEVANGGFAARARKQGKVSGYIRGASGRVYSIQSSWIYKGDGSGKPSGYLMMGKLLSPEVLSDALRVKVALDPQPDPALEKALLDNPAHTIASPSKNSIRNQIGLIDNAGKVQAVITFETPRSITRTGIQAVRSAMAAMGLSLLALAVLLALGIHRIAVMRLQNLRSHVATFRTGRRRIAPELIAGKDEIGDLARQFDRLAEELAEAEDELRRSSYVQGKADSAVGLLHNVRNALVPLQVKYDKWQQEDRRPLRSQLVQALDELGSDSCPDERRAPLEDFAKSASRKLAELGTTRSEEIIDIKHSIDQILAILSDYHYDSSAKPILEAVDVEALLRREAANLEITAGTPIALILNDPIPLVLANQIHLQQILTNVLINAAEAMKAGGAAEWTLNVTCAQDPATGMAEIAIHDNGEGAAPEVLAHAFGRGFSTRKNKSSGMGLHWSSNTMRAMGGELTLDCRGPGHGATVRLTLPATLQAEPATDHEIAA